MIKRILYITFITALVGALVYFYIQVNEHSEIDEHIDLMAVLPNSPGIILDVPQLNKISDKKQLHSEMWTALQSITPIKSYADQWERWNTLAIQNAELYNWANNPAIFSYHLVGKSCTSFQAIKFSNKAVDKAWKMIVKTSDLTQEKVYNNVEIFKLKGAPLEYCYFNSGFFVKSSSAILLEQSIRNLQGESQTDASLESLKKTKGSGVDVNIYVNYPILQKMISEFSFPNSELSTRLKQLGEWGELDYSINESNIILNGFSSYREKDYWQIFSKQESMKMTIHEAIPAHSKGFLAFSIADMKQFRTDYEIYRQQDVSYNGYKQWLTDCNKQGATNIQAIFDQMIDGEIALRHDDYGSPQTDESLVIVKTKSASKTKEALWGMISDYAKKTKQNSSNFSSKLSIDSETSMTIYTLPFSKAFEHLYGKVFSSIEAKYFCFYDNYLFFGPDKEVLKKAIMANIRKQNYANEPNFIELFSSFSAKNSIFYFGLSSNIIPHIEKTAGDRLCKESGVNSDKLGDFYALTYQMVSSGKYAYNSILLNYNPNLKDRPQTVWSSKLDAKVIGKPTFVKNHKTNETEICIQDELNNLYLLSNSGRIIWKRPIGEAIISDIQQIDYYKNNKLQLLFNTPSKLWILDRNGNFVERFPVLLPSKASTGLSLFDYDNNKSYRIFVPTEDKRIYLYGKDGNINGDFKFKTTETPLTTPIQHFRVSGKDFIVFADKNRVYVLNRKGKERVKIKEQFSASVNNSFHLVTGEKPYLVTTDTEGSIMRIFLDGKVDKLSLPPSGEDHYLGVADIENKRRLDYIIINKDKINTYAPNGRLVYSEDIRDAQLSRPYFYKFASNVTKMGIVDTHKNEIYLINGKDGSTYKGFPLAGTTPFSIGFLNASAWRFNLIVGGDNNSLHNYRVK